MKKVMTMMEEDGRELEVHSYPQILEQWIFVIVY